MDSSGDSVAFAYVAFMEYFAARAAIDDGKFMHVLRAQHCRYSQELIYITSLQRNNRELLEELSSELNAVQSRLVGEVDLRLFDDLRSSFAPGETDKETVSTWAPTSG